MYRANSLIVNVKSSIQPIDSTGIKETYSRLELPVLAWNYVSANLEQLQRSILADLKHRNLVVFRSSPRAPELGADAVYWDADAYPDHKEFLAAAEAAGARLITVSAQTLTEDMIEDALEHLNSTRLDREERRTIEIRLKELRRYDGFLCQLELSFSLDRRTYIFEQATDWYDELSELLERIEDSFGSSQEQSPLGGFYSNN